MSGNTSNPAFFSGFSDLYPQLSKFLDAVKQAAPTGTQVPASTSGVNSPLYITDKGASAYSAAGGGSTTYGPAPSGGGTPPVTSQTDGAKQVVTKFIQTLTDVQVGYMTGIGFSGNPAPKAPPTLTSKQADIVQAVYGLWDNSASAYMKNDTNAGDSARSTLQNTLKQYDAAVQTLGKTPAPKQS